MNNSINSVKSDLEKVRDAFQRSLDAHGFGFQHAVLTKLKSLSNDGPASWQLVGSEFPVRVRDADTSIDFVFQHPAGLYYLVGECKRVNPALSEWCFVRTSPSSRPQSDGDLTVEMVWRGANDRVGAGITNFRRHSFYADLGREIRGDASGEAGGGGRGAIEDAVSQVLRGVNGLASKVASFRDNLPLQHPIPIVPVVFTTARLWYSQACLSDAELPLGTSDLTGASFGQVPWVPLQYHQSMGLAHELPRSAVLTQLSEQLVHLHRRTVFIVNVDGIEDFVAWSLTDG